MFSVAPNVNQVTFGATDVRQRDIWNLASVGGTTRDFYYFLYVLKNLSRSLKIFYSPSSSLQPPSILFRSLGIHRFYNDFHLIPLFYFKGFYFSQLCIEIGCLASYTLYKSVFRSKIVFREAYGRKHLYIPSLLCKRNAVETNSRKHYNSSVFGK